MFYLFLSMDFFNFVWNLKFPDTQQRTDRCNKRFFPLQNLPGRRRKREKKKPFLFEAIPMDCSIVVCWSQKNTQRGFDVMNYVKIYSQTCMQRQPSRCVAVVNKWSLFKDNFTLWRPKLGFLNSGCCRQVVTIRGWSLSQ